MSVDSAAVAAVTGFVRALPLQLFDAPDARSLALLRRQWHYASLYDGRVFMGCRSRLTDNGPETEHIPLPPALEKRLAETRAKLDAIE